MKNNTRLQWKYIEIMMKTLSWSAYLVKSDQNKDDAII